MLNHALLSIMQEAGTKVMILGEDVERAELMGSKLTRREMQRQLLILANAADSIPAAIRDQLPELEWDGWQKIGKALRLASAASDTDTDEALWFALRSLTPATLMWLQVHRQANPQLFAFSV